MTSFFYKHRFWLWPLLAVLIITPFTPALDLSITRYFYPFHSNPFFDFLYHYGFLPADLTAAAGLILFLLACIIPSWKKLRAPTLVLVLTLAIGSGIITHALLKDHWGRPRPKQVIEFGGKQQFRPYYEPNLFNQPQPSKSFPCGHCSTGFYFFALAFIGRRENNRFLYWLGMILALGLGSLLSLTRIVQGGHFFSDVLFSALIMWFAAYISDLISYSMFSPKGED